MTKRDEKEILKRVDGLHLSRRLHMENYEARKLEHYGRLNLRCSRKLPLDRLIDGLLHMLGVFSLGEKVASNFEVNVNPVSIPHLPPAFEGYRILQLSDLHFGPESNLLEALMGHIESQSFNLCVITGDFNFEGGHPYHDAMQHLATLRPALGKRVVAVLGNHDEFCLVPEIEALDITVLLNEQIDIQDNGVSFSLLGLDDPHYFSTDNLEKLRPLALDKLTVLLSHSSELYRESERAGVTFMMAGHSHGGQLCLPGGYPVMNNAKSPRQLIAGAWRYGTLQGYTSKGASGNSRDVRLFCAPEIVIHEFQASRVVE